MTTLRYSADNSEVRYNIGATAAAGNFTGAYTLAVLFRRRTTSGFQSILAHHGSDGLVKIGMEFNGTTLNVGDDGAIRTGPTTISNTTDWWILAVTKASGTVTPRWHIKNVTTGAAWAHTNASGTLGNPASQSGGTVRTGEWQDVDDANQNMGIDAGWAAALSDLEVEALATGLQTSAWTTHAVAASYVHEQIDNASIPDLKGNGVTLNVVNGTTEEATDPPGWTFNGSGAVASIPSLVMAPILG